MRSTKTGIAEIVATSRRITNPFVSRESRVASLCYALLPV